MKIVTREQLLKMPTGVLYSDYEPHVIENLYMKGETIGDVDWYMNGLLDCVMTFKADKSDLDEVLNDSKENGESFEMEYLQLNRDGIFDNSKLYAVYERKDIKKLLVVIQTLSKDYPVI